MHEYGVARDIVRYAIDEAVRQGAGRVAAMKVRVGRQGHINKEALAFGIRAASHGTVAEGAELQLTDAAGSGVVLESIDLEEAHQCA